MTITRRIIVLDAPDLDAESEFWAQLLGGEVVQKDDGWHTVSVDGKAYLGVQLAPNLETANWPHGTPQQIHLDLYVDDIAAEHERALSIGARLLQDADRTAQDGFVVYADPAGHPFCLCWG